jgi:hypothetical protein
MCSSQNNAGAWPVLPTRCTQARTVVGRLEVVSKHFADMCVVSEITSRQIRAARALISLSQADLAKAAEVSRSHIADIENEKTSRLRGECGRHDYGTVALHSDAESQIRS